MNHSYKNQNTQPRNGNGRKVSQRGLLSIAMLLVSLGALAIAMLGGAKMVADVLRNRDGGTDVEVQIIVVLLPYAVGWLTAMVAIRVYGNLILPSLINWATWLCLAAVCYLYVAILNRMYMQPADPVRFFKYMMVMAGGLGALIGLHLIVEEHDLRPFAVPLLVIGMIQLGMIVFRYVFDTAGVNTGFLWKDLTFFLAMMIVSISMLAHWGLLEPLRKQIAYYFDRGSDSIRTQD